MMHLRTLASRTQAVKRLMAPGIQMPVYVLMYVTNRCDAKCKHCFYWQELNHNPRAEMSVDEFDQLARSMGPMLQVTLTGGSPELRKDLSDVAGRFYEHCNPANMTWCCNGYHHERIVTHAQKVMEQCHELTLTVAVSLDGLGDEHDQYRGMPGLFDRVQTTFKGLEKLKRIYGARLRLGVGIVVSGLNKEKSIVTAKWARENLPIDVLKPILVRGHEELNPTPDSIALDRTAGRSYLQVLDQDEAYLKAGHNSLASGIAFTVSVKEMVQRDLISEIQETGSAPHKCAAARETAVIYANGEVAGCELRPEKLGNLREVGMDFKKIWYNEAAKDFRNELDPLRCPGCYHHCFISPPIFRSPRFWPKLAGAALKIWREHGVDDVR